MRRPADNVISQPWRRLRTRIPLSILLLLVLLVPSLTFYLGMASSMALGTCAVAVVVICSLAPQRLANPDAGQAVRLTNGAAILLLFVVIALHLVIATVIRPVDFERAVLSFVPLALVLLSGYGLGRLLATSRDRDIKRAVYLCFWTMCALSLLALGGYIPPHSESYFKPVFPYTEPSHFALAILPYMMFCCVSLGGRARVAMLLGGLAMGLALESLTLIAGWLLITSICLRSSAIPLLLALLALLATQLDLIYYLDRLDFSGDSPNLSTLVYLQGWQLITESLTLSTGWGLGFQQLGVQGSDSVAAGLIFEILGDNSNLLDGGFAFAKLTSEFGVLILPLMLWYFPLAWRAARGLRHRSQGASQEAPAITLAQCVVVSFVVELFVRGSGYFSGSTLLLVAAITILSTRRWAPLAGVKAERRRHRRHRPSTIGSNDLDLSRGN